MFLVNSAQKFKYQPGYLKVKTSELKLSLFN